MIPLILNEVEEQLKVNNIYKKKIDNPNEFELIHKQIIKNNWKTLQFKTINCNEKELVLKDNNKRRIDKDLKLFVSKRLSEYDDILLKYNWESLQYNTYVNIMRFYKQTDDVKM